MQEINDIFVDLDTPSSFDEDLNISYAFTDSANAHILSLSEFFTEWYLFDSSREKNIQQFLDEEDLNDIFTESEFMDLMCGNAYVDDEIIQLIALKIPFHITINKLHTVNKLAEKNNPDAYRIKHKSTLIDKIIKAHESAKQRKKRQRHEHYQKNKEYIQQKEREYRLKNNEKIRKRQREYHQKNKEHLKQYGHEYYQKNKERIKQNAKEYYLKNKNYSKEYYDVHKEGILKQFKESRILIQETRKAAKIMCAAYVFLSNFRKTNKTEYKELYPRYQDPLRHMLKTCIALQNKDVNMCPLCKKKCQNTLEQSCNQKILSLPGALKKIKTIAKDLKQR